MEPPPCRFGCNECWAEGKVGDPDILPSGTAVVHLVVESENVHGNDIAAG